MYVCPHRSWSDFFVHRKIVDGHGSNLSRWMVLAAFPLFYVVTKFDRSVFWFNRAVRLIKLNYYFFFFCYINFIFHVI